MATRTGVLVVLLLGVTATIATAETLQKFPLLMPHVKPERAETYFCTPIRIDPAQEYYITAFQPNASMETAHHMLLYGCETPGTDEEVWNCGEMALAQPGIKSAPVCATGSQVIYAWAKDAPKLVLPEGVAFKVGGRSPIQYLVLQVHYASVEKFKDGSTDDSGVFLYYTETPQPKSAGVLLMGTGGRINPKSVEYMETACTINEDKILHPFAFRTHTHALGRVVSGYKVTRKGYFDDWELIGKRDPQLPQMFYPVYKDVVLRKGDTVAARCTMESKRDRTTRIGAYNKDEMCNFYIMYWTTSPEPLDQKYCFTPGPPLYHWRDEFYSLPDDASTIPASQGPRGGYHHHHY
ncbi:peptidylglycine alpha-hydroxylating monooxygenase-like isoform X2 [Homarus americanus]|uniref:peptidylglycine alpha-hydroxylating monooxygenase-like isoform X2 n=1 Tax=Homarus americanus TaxID=6706 RepID=UPI001C459138|nr:peptidylglycine alpha-hydroxylating monooxygenase-like isoform X2 [Homarus americanus]